MSRTKNIIIIAGSAVVITLLFIIIFDRADYKQITPNTFKEYKVAKRGNDTTRKPTDWFTISRAYPYDDIPFLM